ncbi:MAG: acyltransferase [Burkholderiaceae bacterium]|nr:acyltransferase [Burkholderiaceae bacterium]
MKHLPALDGVRGLAILLVMLFHLGLPGFSLGWAGVPLFFVLSGFLITGLLIEEKGAKFSSYLRSFYVKRTLRIFPLFYAYLAFNLALLVVTGRSFEGYAWYLLYLQNHQIGLALDAGGYVPGIVGHTWSLAVEEQFYLAWPFLVYFLNRRQLAWLCIALIVASPVTRWLILSSSGNVYLANVTLPSCLDMMAYGGLLALLRSSEMGTKLVFALSGLGLAVVAYAISDLGLASFWEPKLWANSAFYLYTALAFVFGSVIWLAAVKPNALLVRLLSSRALLFTGKISYGLYIWHLICFLAVAKLATRFPSPATVWVSPLVSLALAYAVSIASYYWFEVHFLRLKERFAARRSTSAGELERA